MPFSKYDVYAQLIRRGVESGFHVVPEYRVRPSFEQTKREVDLTWCIANPSATGSSRLLPAAAFEIEGHDVERRREGKYNGIEKDADSLLSVARLLSIDAALDLMPAVAVILFQLGASGEFHNRAMNSENVAGHRRRFGEHSRMLAQRHADELPAKAAHLDESAVILDDDLAARLDQITKLAIECRNAILAHS